MGKTGEALRRDHACLHAETSHALFGFGLLRRILIPVADQGYSMPLRQMANQVENTNPLARVSGIWEFFVNDYDVHTVPSNSPQRARATSSRRACRPAVQDNLASKILNSGNGWSLV